MDEHDETVTSSFHSLAGCKKAEDDENCVTALMGLVKRPRTGAASDTGEVHPPALLAVPV